MADGSHYEDVAAALWATGERLWHEAHDACALHAWAREVRRAREAELARLELELAQLVARVRTERAALLEAITDEETAARMLGLATSEAA